MENLTYWHRQSNTKPLYPDFEWNKPGRRDQAGRLAIVGGNKLGFASLAESYQTALDSGAGQVRLLLPDALKSVVPKQITDVVYAPSNHSGGLATEALAEALAIAKWSDGLLLVGDAGRSSQTAVIYEQLVSQYPGKVTLTRDAIDLLRPASTTLMERPETLLVMSFAQLQKLFQAVYYPKVLTFNMQLMQLVEALHKFTITHPATISVFHQEQMVLASGGEVITQPWQNPMQVWRGQVATKAATYWLWDKNILAAFAASIHSDS